jgi:hypothetical protein
MERQLTGETENEEHAMGALKTTLKVIGSSEKSKK